MTVCCESKPLSMRENSAEMDHLACGGEAWWSQRTGHRAADAQACRHARAVQREVRAVDQFDPHIGQGRKHDVAVKAQHGVAAAKRLWGRRIDPDDIVGAERRDGWRVVRIHGGVQAPQELSSKGRVDRIHVGWHEYLR
jgi:hypothetical protein